MAPPPNGSHSSAPPSPLALAPNLGREKKAGSAATAPLKSGNFWALRGVLGQPPYQVSMP